MMLTRVVAGLVVCSALAGWCTLAAPTFAAAESTSPDHAAESHGQGGQTPLDFKRDLALWTGVVFLLLLAVLWKYAWGPIARGLQRREQGIANQISQAEESNRQARQLLAEYEQKLADAGDEVHGILDRARHDAEQLGREMLEKTKQEVKGEHQRAVRQIDAATAAAIKELAEQGATLAVELAGKIVRAKLDPKDHAQLIEQAVAGFGGQKPGPGGNK